jgi:histidinol-phosphate aminotransferase
MLDLTRVVKKGVYETQRRHTRERLSFRKSFLRLDLNENLTTLPPEQFADMMSRIRPETLTAYPDLSAIYRKMAQYIGVEEDMIVLTNGSDMGIKTIFDVCIGKGDHIVLHDPYFLMYERYAGFFEAQFDAIPVTETWIANVEAMLTKVRPNTRMVVIEDPSGNVGSGLSTQVLERMAAELERKHVLLVIDEAYVGVEKSGRENLGLLGKHDNVIIVRTMSKAHGLAGGRLGILVTNRALARELYKVRSLYEIGGVTANVAEWHLDHPEILDQYRVTVERSKAFLFEQFERMGLPYKDTPANFVIVEIDRGNSTIAAAGRLREKGILIGKAYTLPHLLGWARITVGELSHCRQLVGALEELFAERARAA